MNLTDTYSFKYDIKYIQFDYFIFKSNMKK